MIDDPIRLHGAVFEAGTSRDLDAVMDVMTAAFGDRFGEAWTRSQCAGILPMSGVSLVIARDDANGSAVGFSLFRSVADEAELLLLGVVPSHRRRGIGSALLEQFMETARRSGAGRVHLEVRDGNPAIGMYRSAGFKQVGRRRKYYHGENGSDFDALTLSRAL